MEPENKNLSTKLLIIGYCKPLSQLTAEGGIEELVSSYLEEYSDQTSCSATSIHSGSQFAILK